MLRPLATCLGALALVLALSAAAAAPAAKGSATARRRTGGTTAASADKASAAARSRAATAPRRLTDIHIEGEIPVPQVLFITARDQRRFLESHHQRYLKTARELAEATPIPGRIVWTRGTPPRAPEGGAP